MESYFVLPRNFKADRPPNAKDYPSLDEAVDLLQKMRLRTLKERRDRAIFALAFVSGLRADALVTLRLRHVDIGAKRVLHDGEDLRAKNGKSFVVNWFPKTEPFREVFLGWHEECVALGMTPDDALFPNACALARLGPKLIAIDRLPFEPMRTSAAVGQAFREASEGLGHSYSPHAARHTLANLGDKICRTPEERKAWSLNLGHSSETVTLTHYGKVKDGRKDEIFEAFDRDEPMSSEEVELMLDYHDHYLVRGTPEFERAEALVNNRRNRRLGGPA